MGFTLNQLEQERQIRKLQKKEDKDTSDYEQLSNLPKINNVELKGDKTTGDLGINADNVKLSDDTKSVEEVLDELTGGYVISSSYTELTKNVEFACPADGYLFIGYASNVLVDIKYKTNGTLFTLVRRNLTASGSSIDPIYVRKGMVLTWDNESTNSSLVYRALEKV